MTPRPVVLCVDDDRQNLALLEALLVPEGCDVRPAGSGEEALRLIESEIPDLILLDVMMPWMSGLQVLARLRSDERTRLIPVILLTALSQSEDRVAGIEAGCDDFIVKPFDRVEMSARVKSLLKLCHYRRSLDEKEKFEAVIREMGDGVVVCRPDWTIAHANRSASNLLAAPESGRASFLDLLFSGYRVSLPREELADLSKPRRRFEARREETAQFKALCLEATLEALKDPSGAVTSIVATLRDATRERKDEELTQTFLAMISHKLLTPIHVVATSLELIKEGKETGLSQQEIDRALETAGNRTRELAQLVRKLLRFVEIQSRSFQQVHSGEAFASFLEETKKKLSAKYGKACVIDKSGARAKFRGWELLAVEEILDNSFKFGPEKSLRVELLLSEDSLTLSDDGPGIPPEEIDRIFEPFHQIYKTFHGNIPGAGLGLALVKKLAELNGARVRVESAVGKGAAFTIAF